MSSSAPNDQPWTVLRLLEWTTEFFQQRGSQSPRLDAEILLAHARHCARIELYTAFAEQPSDEEKAAFREMVRRRGDGAPVAHLVGYKEFYSLQIRVDENVLIPRPETEHLVIEALDVAKALAITDRPLRIADIGTGSGAIAVALAKHLSGAEITAVDTSDAALQIANWNAQQHEVAAQIRMIRSDLLAGVESPPQFDIICSNPPYVTTAEYASLDRMVREYEPRQALLAGTTGTEVIERIIAEAPARLRGGGRLIIELSPMIAEACAALVDAHDDWAEPRFIKDLAGHNRVLSVARR